MKESSHRGLTTIRHLRVVIFHLICIGCLIIIDVIIVGPGAVSTPIWDKAGEADISGYSRSPYAQILKNFQAYFIKSGREGLPPERIGMTVLKALTTAHPRIRYAVVPKPLMNWYLPRLLPRRFVDRVVGRALGLLPK